jgi:hypothetical protein
MARSKPTLELVRARFVTFVSFCLVFSAALMRIGWTIKRESRGSHRIPSRLAGWREISQLVG